MFLYWDGYEIDGSDTDFEIILPESIQVLEFVESFMSMPVFSNEPTPEYKNCGLRCNGAWHSDGCRIISFDELQDKLLSNDYLKIAITLNCQHIDLLPNKIQEEIYAKSVSRKCINVLNNPSESEEQFDYTKAENPCLAPLVQTFFDRGGMTMQLSISKGKEGISAYLNVGPCAHFEYTMYVLDYMSERFPSIKIDMESGFSAYCCNFHPSSMYQYEKVLIPVKHSVNHTLKHLTEYGLTSFYVSYDKNRWPRMSCASNRFFPATRMGECVKKETHLPFADYLNLIETSLADESDPARQMFNTTVNILLPLPEMIAGEVAPSPIEGRMQIIGRLWPYTGYMLFYNKNGITICELRISAEMKEYLNTWLAKSEVGVIDLFKSEIYKRCKEQDTQ